ncbi:MAG TPA: 3'-5' exonuclease, partial [Anaerolineales bacterium]|nr:3'-5' exonuclease [Anaerolineales bacterium]
MSRWDAIRTAKAWLKRRPVYLDTETTGLDEGAEIIEIAVVDTNG